VSQTDTLEQGGCGFAHAMPHRAAIVNREHQQSRGGRNHQQIDDEIQSERSQVGASNEPRIQTQQMRVCRHERCRILRAGKLIADNVRRRLRVGCIERHLEPELPVLRGFPAAPRLVCGSQDRVGASRIADARRLNG